MFVSELLLKLKKPGQTATSNIQFFLRTKIFLSESSLFLKWFYQLFKFWHQCYQICKPHHPHHLTLYEVSWSFFCTVNTVQPSSVIASQLSWILCIYVSAVNLASYSLLFKVFYIYIFFNLPDILSWLFFHWNCNSSLLCWLQVQVKLWK